MQKPLKDEYAPFFQRYMDLIPEGTFDHILQENTQSIINFFNNLPTNKHDHRYADEKWSIKQILLHIADTERIMTYRALTGIRGDAEVVTYPIDPDLYSNNTNVSERSLQDILEEFTAIRNASQKLFKHTTEEQCTKRIQMKDGNSFTVRALGYIIIGHPIHHQNIINSKYI